MFEWNKVIYKDCLNLEDGLSTLEDKSIDLCLTDPPYNVRAKRENIFRSGETPFLKNYKKIDYFDWKDDYYSWSKKWFKEIKRICKYLIFTCGQKQMKFWMINFPPREILIHYKKNGNGMSYGGAAMRNAYEPYFLYGKLPHAVFCSNVWDFPLENGFNRRYNFTHPHPKELPVYSYILRAIKPKTVIDPFLGSGTTAEACQKLGIKWLGYEINEIYKTDIERRINNCKIEPQQIKMEGFV